MSLKKLLAAVVGVAVVLGGLWAGIWYYGGWDMPVRGAPESPRYFIAGRGVGLHVYPAPPWTPGDPLITYIGYHTLLVRLSGVRAITDPFWGDRIGWHKRLRRPAFPLGEVGPVDVVLLTSAGAGHFDPDALSALADGAVLVVPEGLARRCEDLGFSSVEGLPEWGIAEVAGVEVVAVPTSSRGACGYIVTDGASTVYLAGPTGPFEGLRRVAEYWRVDVMALPYLGGVLGEVFSPREAAAAVRMVRPVAAVPLGYRTIARLPFFWTALSPEEFAHMASTRRSRVVPMDVGDRLEIIR